MNKLKELLGEFLGTFILVFIGCGAVGVTILFGWLGSLLEVAIVWGVGVTLAIFASRKLSFAHLNPAVSLAMTLAGQLSIKKFISYTISQTIGAFVAGAALYALLSGDLASFEASNGIVRGTLESQNSAMMFGEFFPNPGYADQLNVSVYLACGMEALGTFLLVAAIFWLVQLKRLNKNLIPPLIGLTVTLIICFVAPYTQAGLNPARDFGPRILAYLCGWENAAFPATNFGFLTVYILSPLFGGVVAFYLMRFFKKA
ncbi:MAG: glycerol uptake facilitator protein [Crocinitomix sp.]|jgi:glycerol uptake facilitator protein